MRLVGELEGTEDGGKLEPTLAVLLRCIEHLKTVRIREIELQVQYQVLTGSVGLGQSLGYGWWRISNQALCIDEILQPAL